MTMDVLCREYQLQSVPVVTATVTTGVTLHLALGAVLAVMTTQGRAATQPHQTAMGVAAIMDPHPLVMVSAAVTNLCTPAANDPKYTDEGLPWQPFIVGIQFKSSPNNESRPNPSKQTVQHHTKSFKKVRMSVAPLFFFSSRIAMPGYFALLLEGLAFDSVVVWERETAVLFRFEYAGEA